MPSPAAHELAERPTPLLHPRTGDHPAGHLSAITSAVASPGQRLAHVAQILATGDPHTWLTLRARHLPGPDGRCTGCRSSRQPAERWPCKLRGIADQAAALVEAERR
jgi:hypothetical protein